jgi:hypothetical protein
MYTIYQLMMCANVYLINFKYEMRMKALNITSLFGERIVHTVIPDTSGIAFFIRMRFPIKLGMTVWISSKAIPARRPE